MNHTKKFRQHLVNVGQVQTSLVIKELSRNDFGIYKCRAESMAGYSDATIELKGNYVHTKEIDIHSPLRIFFFLEESHRSTIMNSREQSTTARNQILKRNQSNDQHSLEKINSDKFVFSC